MRIDSTNSSGDRAIKNALGVAARYAAARLNALIVQELESSPQVAVEETEALPQGGAGAPAS